MVNKKELKEKEIIEMGERIKEFNRITTEDKQRRNRKLFLTLFTGALVIFVFIFILMGYENISELNYIVDLKVFSIIAIAVTICIFEHAYKKDSGELAITGIEILLVSFFILSLYYILQYKYFDYQYYLLFCMFIFLVYYLLKTFIIYIRENYKYRKTAQDIKKIVEKN